MDFLKRRAHRLIDTLHCIQNQLMKQITPEHNAEPYCKTVVLKDGAYSFREGFVATSVNKIDDENRVITVFLTNEDVYNMAIGYPPTMVPLYDGDIKQEHNIFINQALKPTCTIKTDLTSSIIDDETLKFINSIQGMGCETEKTTDATAITPPAFVLTDTATGTTATPSLPTPPQPIPEPSTSKAKAPRKRPAIKAARKVTAKKPKTLAFSLENNYVSSN